MVHGSVTGGLTVRLEEHENKRTRSGRLLTHSGFPLPRASRLGEAKASEFYRSLRLSGRLSCAQNPSKQNYGYMLIKDTSPGISGRTPCIPPLGHTAQGSGVWGIHCQAYLFLSHSDT